MDFNKMYNELIKKAKSETRLKLTPNDPNYICYHGHHILPKSVGGEGDYGDWSHPNIVPLTPEEHWDAHYYLWKSNLEKLEFAVAFYLISHTTKNKKLTREEYGILKRQEAQWLSEHRKGNKNPMFGKNAFEGKTEEEMKIIGQHLSEALKGKNTGIRIIHKKTGKVRLIKEGQPIPKEYMLYRNSGRSYFTDEAREKMSKSAKARGYNGCFDYDKFGRHWYNNGKECKFVKECPEGFKPGRLLNKSMKRIGELNSQHMKGKHWFTNGTENKLDYKCPEGFKPGRTILKD